MFENRKPKTENRKPPLRICVPVVEATVNRARGKYQRAARKGLWTEVRLDYLEEPAPDLKRLFRSLPGPVIATNRLAAEGGRWTGTEVASSGPPGPGPGSGRDLPGPGAGRGRELPPGDWARRGRPRLILSWHDFAGTPETARLEAVLEEMLAAEADIVKLVALAREPADNLRMLSLIPRARAQGKEIIAFCMGPLGKWSRVAAPLVGELAHLRPFQQDRGLGPGAAHGERFEAGVEDLEIAVSM